MNRDFSKRYSNALLHSTRPRTVLHFLSVYNAQVAPRHTRSPDKAGTLKLGIQLASDFPVGLEKEDNSFCGLTEIHGRGRAEVRREN